MWVSASHPAPTAGQDPWTSSRSSPHPADVGRIRADDGAAQRGVRRLLVHVLPDDARRQDLRRRRQPLAQAAPGRGGPCARGAVVDGDEAVAWAQYGSPEELPNIYHRKQYDETQAFVPDTAVTCVYWGTRFQATHRPQRFDRAGRRAHRAGRRRRGRASRAPPSRLPRTSPSPSAPTTINEAPPPPRRASRRRVKAPAECADATSGTLTVHEVTLGRRRVTAFAGLGARQLRHRPAGLRPGDPLELHGADDRAHRTGQHLEDRGGHGAGRRVGRPPSARRSAPAPTPSWRSPPTPAAAQTRRRPTPRAR